MEKRKKLLKGKTISKLIAGLLALLVIINTCSSGVLWSVNAAGDPEASISIAGSTITFDFTKVTDISGVDDASAFDWSAKTDDEKRSMFANLFHQNLDDISKVDLSIVADTSETTKAKSMSLTLNDGCYSPTDNEYVNGITNTVIVLKNDAFSQSGAEFENGYVIAEYFVCSLNADGTDYDTSSVTTEIVDMTNPVYVINPVVNADGKIELSGDRILTADGDSCSVKFTPGEDFNISDLKENDSSVKADVSLAADGTYTFGYNYSDLAAKYTSSTDINVEADYEYKPTEFGDITVSSPVYRGGEYTVSIADITIHDSSIGEDGISWSLVDSDDEVTEYSNAELTKVDSKNYTLKVSDDAQDGDKFKVYVTDNNGVDKFSDEITVSVPNAVTPDDYKFYTSADGTAEAQKNEAGWYVDETFMKIDSTNTNGFNKIEEKDGAGLADSVSFTESNGANENNKRSFRLVKATGNKIEKSSEWFIPEIKVDASAPVIDAISCTLADDAWSNQKQTITVTASDSISGVKEVKYSLKADKSDAKTATLQDGKYTFDTAQEDGTKPTYYVWAVDNAGNESSVSSKTVQLEYQKPVIVSVTNPSETDFVKEGHKIKVVVKDEGGSDISKITYQIPNGTPVDVPVSTATKVDDTYEFEIDTLKDGDVYITDTNEYTFTAYDNAGNAGDTSKTTVHVDKVAPQVTGITMTTASQWENHRLNTLFGHFSNDTVSITVSAKKNASLSEVKSVKLIYKDINNTEKEITASLAKVGTVVDGVAEYKAVILLEASSAKLVFKDIKVVATDAIGNASVETRYSDLKANAKAEENDILIEKSAPVITFDVASISGNGVYRSADSKLWVAAHRDVSYSITDAESGIYKYTKKLNGTTVGTETTGETGKTDSITGQTLATNAKSETGTVIPAVDTYKYTLSVEAVDNAGNVSSQASDIYVDMKAPVISEVKTTADNDEDGWVDGDVTFNISANDDTGSGVAKVVYYAADNGTDSQFSPAEMVSKAANAKLSDGVYSFTASGEQNKVYYIFAIDNVGNISEVSTKNVKIDLTTPSIDGLSIKTDSDNDTADVNSYKYGNFKNENASVFINVSDGTISSDIKSVKIYDGENLISESVTAVEANKLYRCNIAASKEYNNLKVEVTDNVGHVITKNIAEISDSDSVYSNILKLEKAAPSIDVKFAEKSVKVANNDWFDKNTEITVDISDEVSDINSGIASVTVSLQAADVAPKVTKYDYTDNPEATLNRTYTLSTADIEVPSDGKYDILVEVVDNAGNVSSYTKSVYVDSTAPEVKSVKLYSNDVEFSSLNMLSFGNFYNTDALVKVYYVDANVSSGVDKQNVILHVGDSELTPTGDIVEENRLFVATYKVSLRTDDKLQTEITDNVGHTTGIEPISSKNEAIKNDNLMLENKSADISISNAKAVYTENNAKEWYNSDVTFNVTVSDEQSGIRSVNTDINTTSKVNENYYNLSSKTTEKQYSISTAGSKELDAGSGAYRLTVNTVDNANNTSRQTKTIYIDKTTPSIVKYEFSLKDYKEGSETPVVTTDYGYYFNQTVILTVTAEDIAPTSGLAKINYRLDEVGKQGEVKQAAVSNNTISFEVPKGFKGQIYTQAVDNVGNTGAWQTVQGVIREEYDLHNNSSNVTITPLISTDKKDAAGYNLYAQDVPVRLHVEDTMSGVRTIEWKLESAGDPDANQSGVLQVANGADASQLSGDNGWNVLSRQGNLCTVFEKDIIASSNSNEIVITVKMTDRAGNVSQSINIISIDKTAPQFSISYDNNSDDDGHEGFFKESRIATVTVSERNFNPDAVKFEITNTDNVMPAMTGWTKVSDGTGNLDNTLYSMNVIYSQDGDYTFNVHTTDLAGNADSGIDYGNSVTPSQFTIDKTIPVISLSYDNSQSYGDYYYQNTRTATISINEHNFDASRAIVTVTSKNNDGSDAGNAPSVGTWSSANDVNTAQVVFDKDSNYTIAVQFTDMAGNVAQEIGEQKFCIDYVDPEITIDNVADRHAYNGKDADGNEQKIAPVVTFKDTNLSIEKTTITLTNAAKETVELKGTSSNPSADTRIFTFDNIEEDDIYTLNAEATDNAGRTKNISYRFSVNRNGSTYQLSDETARMNSSYTNDPVDVVVTEINVDALVQDDISVTLAKDNNTKELVADNSAQKNDYLLEKAGEDGEWSEYTYTIRKDNFSEDGNYMVHLYSVDEASNVSQNDLNDDNKKVEIDFNVDKTKPDLSIINIEEGKTYGEDQRNAIISAVDNSYIKELTVTLNDEVVAKLSADEIKAKIDNNENIEVLVSNSTSKQKLEVMAIDAAGNENTTSVSDFLVTSNLWVRFVNNTPLFVATIVILCVVVIGGGTALVLLRRRKAGTGDAE